MDLFEHSKNIFKNWMVLITESQAFFWGAFSLAASRLFQLATFFLPLKILITVSSGLEPSYMDWLPWTISFDLFLVLLICMVPVFYIMYMLFGVLSRRWFDISSEVFQSNRVSMVKAKELQKLKKLHNHIGKAGSEFILCIIALALVAFVNQYLFFITALLVYLVTYLIFKTAMSMKDSDRFGVFKLHRRQCIEYFLSVNYILIFIVILILVKYFSLNVIEAIFSLLITRMLFQALQRYCVESLYLNSQSICKE